MERCIRPVIKQKKQLKLRAKECEASDKVWEKSPHANPMECSEDRTSSTAA